MSTAQSCPEVIRLENSLFPHSRNCGRMDKSQLNRTLRRYKILEYKADDKDLNASIFIAFVNQVWQGNYDIEKTQTALSKTLNITAYDNKMLIGCLRILTDGYYFGTITELLVLPEYQKQGVGNTLLRLAKDHTPTMLYFGAQPGAEKFYEKNDCKKSLQSYTIEKSNS